MPDDQEQSSQSSAEIQAPGGWKASLKGAETSHVVIGLLIIFCTALVLWQMDERERARAKDSAMFIDLHKTTHRLLSGINETQLRTIETVRNSINSNEDSAHMIVYVLTLKQSEREALKLSMPHGLRRQLNSR